MRRPSLNIGPRVPAITSGAAARIAPNVAGWAGRIGPNIAVRVTTVIRTAPKLPYVRYSHNTYPSCDYVDRAVSGECVDRPALVDYGAASASRSQDNSPRRHHLQAAVTPPCTANQIIPQIHDVQSQTLPRRPPPP